MMNLANKKILFLSAYFFGYEKAIIKRLRELGAEVDFYNERPSDSVLSKGLIRVRSNFLQKKISRYYQKILTEIDSKNYDYLLLIKGETIPYFFLEQFKEKNPSAIKIFYSYDAAVEYPKFLKLYPYFDQNFTFEPKDAQKYKLHFRPLFFLNEYRVSTISNQPKYDIAFIGTAHTDRYIIGEKVRELGDEFNLKTFFYYYAPGKVAFVLKKIFDQNLQKFDMKKLSFKKLKHTEIVEVYNDSFSVLDINKPFQKGLTMRTFEALASGKKLLTTNSDIKNYPFYDPENIQILKRDRLEINPEFFKNKFKKIDENLLEKMSIDSWLHCLFFKNQDAYWGILDKKFN
jgi:hypothetical protein